MGEYRYIDQRTAPAGDAGARVTLRLMRDLARDGKRDPLVRSCALELTRHLDQKDYRGEAEALFDFVQSNIRYVGDIAGIETLQTPRTTLEQACGDCDDKSTLLASLLQSIRHPCRFIAIGNGRGNLNHVFVETKIGNHWIALDTTEPRPFGWRPRYRYFMLMHV